MTKPTGRPRGRPKKEQMEVAENRPRRGRRRKLLRHDDDRYAVALCVALSILEGLSERQAAMRATLAIAPVSRFAASKKSKSRSGYRPPFVLDRRTMPGAPHSLWTIATRIRSKASGAHYGGRFDACDGVWLFRIAFVFMIAFRARDPLAKNHAIIFGESVGERDWVIAKIIPAIDATLRGEVIDFLLPDFPMN